MDSKFFDIPFRTISSDSDFCCKDGEVLISDDESVSDVFTDSSINLTDLISFALVRETLPGWHVNPDVFPMKTLIASEPSMEYWTKLASQLLSRFISEADNNSLFVAPFYVMAAWKTKSGNFLSPSQPRFMIPNSSVPLVATDGDIRSSELDFKVAGALGCLYFKMKTSEILRDYIGKIDSLVILVSSPAQSYDSYHSFLPEKHVTTVSFCESLDPKTGEIAKRRICTETLGLAWKANESETIKSNTLKFYPFAEVPLSEVDLAREWTRCEPINSDYKEIKASYSYDEILKSSNDFKGGLTIIEGNDEEIDITTRPLKLSGAGKLKRVTKIYLRGKYTPGNLKIKVLASRDMLKWWCISSRKGGTVVSLPGSLFRFYKVNVSGFLAQGENLQGIVCETN